ncbi:ABC-2 type transport system ATP-binding protein [Actinoplanes campanulatus]|uniref:ABC-2 type transport system ATP-binding protein n=1 Tax=Actinoplanes campanulatus TaxID=113559 RepID=A0A7W5FDV5_9ACTN|nr:ATP-binding cassette domain-containing protein [Actinoplanes campanulatus]MBB3094838.1 ABC-2 type transport system ATP-binding protein [Actinoplanes campanulatus]GGN07731.1 multidrug ABC transporter ATP-binding protein [Actinoplanes campanulatus]GID36132.1 multidrug ABC transporter ATP-binding protein [Actinoplanes campanulatus]
MLELRGLTKRYGDVTAVDDLSCVFRPGRVTGFLGPNGAGKTTTLLLALGLQRPDAGTVRVGGRRYTALDAPMREVGALLDAQAVHPNRSGRDHLRALAAGNRLPVARVGEVLERVGLSAVAGRRAGTFSLGMKQRLGIAAALLGDPAVLLLDEPINGLDPGGIAWVRALLRELAAEGRTVVLSSHLMSEMEQTADHLIVIGRGRLIADTSLTAFLDRAAPAGLLVRAEDPGFPAALSAAGGSVREVPEGGWLVFGLPAYEIGRLALTRRIVLTELSPRRGSLEEVFMSATASSTDFTGHASAPVSAVSGVPGGDPVRSARGSR